MAKIQVPVNVEDPVVLKRFLTSLSSNLNNNAIVTGNAKEQASSIAHMLATNSTANFWDVLGNIDELRTTILNYVQGNLQTNVLQNQKNISIIAEQFGTFYEQALAASWYGLTVKAGGAVAGLEIGSLDPDVTTPDDEKSYFRVIADSFVVGRAYEDISEEEKQYLADNGFPEFGTVYNSATKAPVPAIIVNWNNTEKLYEIFFNGIVAFTHVRDETTGNTLTETLGSITDSLASATESADGLISVFFQINAPTAGMQYGDWWVDTNSNPTLAYRYEDADGQDAGAKSWVDNTKSVIAESFIASATSAAVGDGRLDVWFSTTRPLGASDGDLWVNTTSLATVTRVYDAGADVWDKVSTLKSINAGATVIDGGMIKTASLNANRIGSGRIVNSAAHRADGTINESLVSMDINLDESFIWIK